MKSARINLIVFPYVRHDLLYFFPVALTELDLQEYYEICMMLSEV